MKDYKIKTTSHIIGVEYLDALGEENNEKKEKLKIMRNLYEVSYVGKSFKKFIQKEYETLNIKEDFFSDYFHGGRGFKDFCKQPVLVKKSIEELRVLEKTLVLNTNKK